MTTDHWEHLRPVIADAIRSQPRSLQTRIGPSEIGTPCDACLVCKLAGAPKAEDSLPWLPFIGTCVHERLEGIFNRHPDRYMVETQVTVGQIGGVDITGHADLFDMHTGSVLDWKIVGKTTLTDVRRKGLALSKPAYHVQRNLYGVGFEALGFPVNEVGAVFLPRNELSIDSLHIDVAPFDPDVAKRALDRANEAHDYLTQHGLEAAVAYVGGHDGSDYDCDRYKAHDLSVSDNGNNQPQEILS